MILGGGAVFVVDGDRCSAWPAFDGSPPAAAPSPPTPPCKPRWPSLCSSASTSGRSVITGGSIGPAAIFSPSVEQARPLPVHRREPAQAVRPIPAAVHAAGRHHGRAPQAPRADDGRRLPAAQDDRPGRREAGRLRLRGRAQGRRKGAGPGRAVPRVRAAVPRRGARRRIGGLRRQAGPADQGRPGAAGPPSTPPRTTASSSTPAARSAPGPTASRMSARVSSGSASPTSTSSTRPLR